MFELVFTVGITAVGVAATVWLLLRGVEEDDPCGGCACRFKGRSTGVTNAKKNE